MANQDGQLTVNGTDVYPRTKAELVSIRDDGGLYNSSDVENALIEIYNKINAKVDSVVGKQLSTADYSFEEKSKLAGIEDEANKYIHPSTHPASIIVQDSNSRFVTDSQMSIWDNKETTIDAQNKLDTAKSYTDTKIADLVNSSPATLNTLNELATALGDDPNFATTISTELGNLNTKVDTKADITYTNSELSTKFDKIGGTISGQVIIQGTENENPLITRAIQGSDGSGNVDDLYLNYDPSTTVYVNGSNRILDTRDISSTTQSGIVQLNDNINSTSIVQAATANAVKTTYDYASTKLSMAGGTMTAPITFTDTSKYIFNLSGSLNWGLFWNTTDNTLETHNAGTSMAKVDLDTGDITTSGDIYASGKTVTATTFTGNAATATKLQTARTINGFSFDGTSNISLTPLSIGLGNVTNESKTTMFTNPTFTGIPIGPTATTGTNTTQLATTAFVASSMSSGNSSSATKLATARNIALTGDATGTASFDGTSDASIIVTIVDDSHNHVISNIDNLQSTLDLKSPLLSPTFTGTPVGPTATVGTNTTQLATTAFVTTAVNNKTTITGNAETATKLVTARTINGVSFDGTANIIITADPNAHTHDDRYYTETEIDTKFNTLNGFIVSETLPDVSVRNANTVYFQVTG